MAIEASNSINLTAPSGPTATLTAYFKETGTNVSNNTSTLTVKATLKATGGSSWTNTNGTEDILTVYWHDNRTNADTTVATFGSSSMSTNGTFTAQSTTFTATHKDDGTLSGYAKAKWTKKGGNSWCPASGTVSTANTVLTTIARASEPTLSASSFNIGSSITVYTNRKSSSFTHTVKVNYGSTSYTVATGVGASCTFNSNNIASQLYAQIPNATSYSNTISVTTYNGSTNIGTKTVAYTAKAVASNASPTFTNYTYADTNSATVAVTENNQYLVQGKSTLAVTISTANKAVPKLSASMKNYTATLSGKSVTASFNASANVVLNFTDNAFTAGSQTLAVKATDSRGYYATVDKNVTVLAYTAPTIVASATRTNNFENETTLKISGAYSPLTIGSEAKNAVNSVQYRYKKQSSSTWEQDWTNAVNLQATNAGAYTTTDKVLSLANTDSWDVQIRTIDKLSTSTVSLVVPVGIPIFRIGTNGLVYNNEQPLMPSHVGQIIMSVTLDTAAKVQAIYGGTWAAWGSGRVPVGVNTSDTDFATVQKTGGAKTVTLTLEQIPAHNHTISESNGTAGTVWRLGTHQSKGTNTSMSTNNRGGGQAHTNLQPYITCYFWRRTA